MPEISYSNNDLNFSKSIIILWPRFSSVCILCPQRGCKTNYKDSMKDKLTNQLLSTSNYLHFVEEVFLFSLQGLIIHFRCPTEVDDTRASGHQVTYLFDTGFVVRDLLYFSKFSFILLDKLFRSSITYKELLTSMSLNQRETY